MVDCEQSLFFFRFSEGSSRACERRAAARREGARHENEKEITASLFSCLSRLAPSVTGVVVCVSRAFCSMDQEKRETARSLWLWKIAINI